MRSVKTVVFVLVLAVFAMWLTAGSGHARRARPPRRRPRKTRASKANGRRPRRHGATDLSGVYTSNDENLIPVRAPRRAGRQKLDDIIPDSSEAGEQRDAQRAEADRNRAELRSPLHWFENIFQATARHGWCPDPPDGRCRR